ncbi:MAG: winged helix-turn-helix domain-containing protein, partial [Candidatus Hermodarchaeota archaeon]
MTDRITEHNLINKERKVIKPVNKSIWFNYLYNNYYQPILEILANGPLSVDEIESTYISELGKEKKSKATIYRYLKDLQNVGLVIEVGRRVYSKHKSVGLYDRAATMFIYNFPVIWSTKDGNIIAQTLGNMIKDHFSKKNPSIPNIKKIFARFETDLNTILLELMEKIVSDAATDERAKQALVELKKLDSRGAYAFFDWISTILWFIKQEDYDHIMTKLGEMFNADPREEVVNIPPNGSENKPR